jgi:hypothetical protein
LIEALARIDGDTEISPSQVKVNGYAFNTCSPYTVPGMFLCNYTTPYYSIAPGSWPLSITLSSDDSQLLTTVSTQISTDNIAPEITFDSAPSQNKQNVSFQFTVKDKAGKGLDYSLCSGIKSIEFWDGATKLNEILAPTTSCVYSSSISLRAPSSGVITIKAYDMMNNVAVTSSTGINVDTVSPIIQEDTFSLTIGGAQVNDYIRGGSYSIGASVNIKEDTGLAASSVTLDLTDLGGSSVAAASCTKISADIYQCSWSNIPISLSAEKTANLRITAEDNFGNSDSAVITKTFKIDSTAPSVAAITTGRVYNGKNYIGTVPLTIKMSIDETGSGFYGKNAYLDMSDLNAVYGSKKADNCTVSGSGWDCIWNNITTTKSDGYTSSVYTVYYTADDAGNEATGLSKENIYVDKQAPVFLSVNVTPISNELRASPYFVSGDDIVALVNLRESNGLKLYGNFSKVYTATNDNIEEHAQMMLLIGAAHLALAH